MSTSKKPPPKAKPLVPENGALVSIMVGDRKVAGRCVRNECHVRHGPRKGSVVDGLAVLLDNDGKRWWISEGNWMKTDEVIE